MDSATALAKAKRSLEGLSVGDAFGELFFSRSPHTTSPSELPPGPWRWTDDTHMALSIVETLKTYGRIEQDALAKAFVRRFMEGPHRGYAGGAVTLLRQIAAGEDWRTASPILFGAGSYGNGAAMRAAPIGGYFSADPERAAQEAQASAIITHAHPEGQAGAMAVAAAAAIAANSPHPIGREFLREVLAFVPEGLTRKRIEWAVDISPDQLQEAIRELGTGRQVMAQDTVPFREAHHLGNFEEALWWTAKGRGDCDTTCAIVGGIVALSAPEISADWARRREPLPELLA